MTKLIISSFSESEYDLSSFGFDGSLIIEETKTYVKTQEDDFIIKYRDDSTFEFVSEEGKLLILTEQHRTIIKDILNIEKCINSENSEDIVEELIEEESDV